MSPETIIPLADPIPLPAPFWLFKALLIVTLFLHLIAMNLMFGGGLIAVVTRLFGAKSVENQRLFGDITHKIPTLLAATVTLGVAPLLFVQVLYGQFFYTSSIVMAWPWFMVVVLLVLAYYGFYIVAMKQDKSPGAITWILLTSVVFVFLIGFFYSNNFTLMNTPEIWSQKYFADPAGWNLNLGEPTLIARYLHFVVAAIAIGAFLPIGIGFYRWKSDEEHARFLIHRGGKWFLYATMAQFLIGTWFLITLPREKRLLFMGGNMAATIGFIIGLAGAIAAIVLVSRGLHKTDPRPPLKLAMGIIGVVTLFMILMRDILRDAYLAPYFRSSDLAVSPQLDVLALFLVLFVGGVILWVVMLRKYFQARAAE